MKTYTMYKDHILRDKEEKCNVKLLDIIQAVKDGDKFIVIDHNKQEVTEQVVNAAINKHLVIPLDMAKDLIQSLYEVELNKMNLLPKENNYDRL